VSKRSVSGYDSKESAAHDSGRCAMARMHGARPFEEEEYERQGGVFAPVNGGHEVGCQDDRCAPDELPEDPLSDHGVPGTPDDLPYDYGTETAPAADQQVLSPERRHAGSGQLGETLDDA
jgi:hypothetical protein